LPYLSNFTDFTALEQLSDVTVYYTRRPEEARFADVLILPGSKNTISDLLWLRENGWERTIEEHAAARKPVFGICGGFQMLGREIRDPHRTESDIETLAGLSLLNVKTVLAREKVTRQATARFCEPAYFAGNSADPLFTGYEIHLGDTVLGEDVQPVFYLQRSGEEEGLRDGAVNDDGTIFGTYLHGLFDSAEGLAALVNHWRRIRGKRTSAIVVDPLAERERRYDLLADHYRHNLKLDLIYRALDTEHG
jgi:adenosylcobyric acid synthase